MPGEPPVRYDGGPAGASAGLQPPLPAPVDPAPAIPPPPLPASGIGLPRAEPRPAALSADTAGITNLMAAAFSPDGTLLATADDGGGYIYLWNTATRKLLATLGDPSISPSFVTFLLDGRALATVEGESSTYLWDIATRSRVGVLTDPRSKGVYWAAVSPDGRLLATADGNGSTYLWAITVRKAR